MTKEHENGHAALDEEFKVLLKKSTNDQLMSTMQRLSVILLSEPRMDRVMCLMHKCIMIDDELESRDSSYERVVDDGIFLGMVRENTQALNHLQHHLTVISRHPKFAHLVNDTGGMKVH